jgi:hypothetical protein
MATFGREQFEQSGVVLIGTVRKDGSPRISIVEPCILEGHLLLGMMWRSRKALDLLRDPRLAVHNAICTSTGHEREFTLRGRAIDIRDPGLRSRYVRAVSARTRWEEPTFHLFAVEPESAAMVTYDRREQHVRVWPQGIEFRRPYR